MSGKEYYILKKGSDWAVLLWWGRRELLSSVITNLRRNHREASSSLLCRTSTALLKCSSKTAGEDRRRQSCFIFFLIKLKINTSLEHLINSNQTNNFFAFSFSKTLPRFPGNTTQLVVHDAGKSSSQPRYTFFPSEEYLNKYITNFISISKDRKYFMFQTKN